MQLGCAGEKLVRGRVLAVGRSAQNLSSGELASVNGSYGAGCLNRSGAWSLKSTTGAVLDHPELSVIRGNTACVLSLTSLHTAGGILTARPSFGLSASFGPKASAFGVPLEFYAAAALDDPSFAGNFLLTVLYSADAALDDAVQTAVFQPAVVANTPFDAATQVTIAQRPTARFNTAMDPTTLSALTFIVQQDTTTVPGVVSYDPVTDTATFTPNAALTLDSLYRVTITPGAEDVQHTPLAASYGWTFTTAAVSQGPVYLLSASSFVVLAATTITNSGSTLLRGDLGLSPGNMISGFPPGTITGTRHAADSIALQAQADLATAYSEAAGRSQGSVLTAGDLGGQILKPGLYHSDTSLAVQSADLTLDADGEVDAVFLFQMVSTLTIDPSRQLILTNGARAANVYWQIGSSATLGTMSGFAGTLLAATSITLDTGATLNGRALARDGAVTLDTNAIDRPAP